MKERELRKAYLGDERPEVLNISFEDWKTIKLNEREQEIMELKQSKMKDVDDWAHKSAKQEQEIQELKEGEYAQQKVIEYQQNRIEELEQALK